MIELDQVIEELGRVAFSPADDGSGSALKYSNKLRALELLGKYLGMFERQEQTSAVTIVDDIGRGTDSCTQ